MAIPFYEPKSTETTNDYQNNNSNVSNNVNNAAAHVNYDQVDGANFGGEAMSNPSINMPSAFILTSPSGVATMMLPIQIIPTTTTTILTPPLSPVAGANTPATGAGTHTTPPAMPPTLPNYEQQALAWKMLALTMCKALKEYYLQSVTSKDAFVSQTVQGSPNGEVQPMWK